MHACSPPAGFVLRALATRARNGVDLINKDGGRGVVPGHVEQNSNLRNSMERVHEPEQLGARQGISTASTGRTIFSLSPRHLDVSVDAVTLKNVVLQQDATAYRAQRRFHE